MAATKQVRTVRGSESRARGTGRTAQRRARAPQKGASGRLIDRDDAAALWRGLRTTSGTVIRGIGQRVSQLFREAGARVERLRERAAVPESLREEPAGESGTGSAAKGRKKGAKRAKRQAGAGSGGKTRVKSTKKKPAAAKRAAKSKSRSTGSGASKAAKTKGRSGSSSSSQGTRRAAKARRATTRGKQRSGRKK